MTKFHTIARKLTGIVMAGVLAGSQVSAAPAWAQEDGAYQTAAADCYSVGEQVAAQNGGTLAKASASNRGGQTVCVIVVLVPGKDGQRPRRVQVVVPAN
jgi:hypothetical protein